MWKTVGFGFWAGQQGNFQGIVAGEGRESDFSEPLDGGKSKMSSPQGGVPGNSSKK